MIGEIELDQPIEGIADENSWNYYHISNVDSTSLLVVTINETATSGDCDLYVKQGSRPSAYDFSYKDSSANKVSSVSIPNPGRDDWEIGVYGYDDCHYFITLSLQTQASCPSNCNSHGRCVQDRCVCDAGWLPPACNTFVRPLEDMEITKDAGYSYYYVVARGSVVQIDALSGQTEADMKLIVSEGNLPTLINYLAADLSHSSDFRHILIKRPEAMIGVNSTYVIGVYSTLTLTFRLLVWNSPI